MSFITQDKTNWKFLLIIFSLTAIVGGGALWYMAKEEQPYETVKIQKIQKESTQGAEEMAVLSTNFSYPYPISWHAGGEAGAIFSLTGLVLGNIAAPPNTIKSYEVGNYETGENIYALVLIVKIKMDDNKDKWGRNPTAPITIKRVINEEGDMLSPNTKQFFFPGTGGMSSPPSASYLDQKIIFVVPKEEREFYIQTLGDKNTDAVFKVYISNDNELKVEPPATQG